MKLSLILCFLCVVLGCKKSENNVVSFPVQEKITTEMDAVMKSSDLPAIVAMASNKKGEEVSYSYGKAIWGANDAVTPQHIFQLQSMTKLITSIAALQLVERGEIALDDDLSAVLPILKTIPILHKGKLTSPKNAITLRHLLTHTSGFGYTFTDLELSQFPYTNWNYPDGPRRFESGTQFLYGTSLAWVGKVIEKVSNTSLDIYVKEHITKPLNMQRTFFNVPDSLQQFIVTRGFRGADGKQSLRAIKDRVPRRKVTSYSGDDGLWSSPSDYMQLLKCMLNYGTLNGVKILEKGTVEEMKNNQIGDISMDASGNYFNPAYCCNLENFTTESTKWGLAWAIDTEGKAYGRKPGTVYWGGMMNTYFYIDYTSEVAVCVFSQHIPFNHKATTTFLDSFSQVLYAN
ncbi:serine hydrolase [Tenacibaculum sp. SG-28]|uniref:serine hydrolase domain-containing protein n=1 Tax=Tenacibaculum sp. SG-28 TaxID=754426 RepID=UPI000CF56048|nr:serine hydrolase domain-containing protein [Tenacibaculum sp. SG-28]PQJ21132.1 hypothetical protein BSU00_09000 [Tenacibaculum sp. SG-28]